MSPSFMRNMWCHSQQRSNEAHQIKATFGYKSYVAKKKPIEFFQRQKQIMRSQQKCVSSATNVNVGMLRASVFISYNIAKCKKPFNIGETLVKPCIIDACRHVLGEEAAKEMAKIPLSNDTVCRRITAISADIEEQLLERLNQSESDGFALQLDESTDVSNQAILTVCVRYPYEEEILEDILLISSLPTRTTAAEIFRVVDEYFSKKNLNWKRVVGICTDGAAAMTGTTAGVTTKIKEVAHSDLQITHCIIHREMLASKQMSADLCSVISDCVKIINLVKANPLNSRLFHALCEELGAEHSVLLLHTDVRWLSRGKALSRIYELRKEVQHFLKQKKAVAADLFDDHEWVAKLAYLSDIFGLINHLNSQLQGPMTNMFTLASKIEAFKKKLQVWKGRVQSKNFDMFSCFHELVSETEFDVISEEIVTVIADHLQNLIWRFDTYFPAEEDVRKGNMWVINPFLFAEHPDNNLSSAEQDNLIELTSDPVLREQFHRDTLTTFWLKMRQEYPSLSCKAVRKLLPFASTYLCESAFSAMTATKTKYRNRLDVASCLRVAISPVSPKFEKIVSEIQAQRSH